MDSHQIIGRLKSQFNPKTVEGMARYGINPHNAYGVSMPTLRQMAKESGRDHDLALQLWDSGIHEAKILATLIDDPKWVTEAQMEAWVLDFDSWDICDQCCQNLFGRTQFVLKKAAEWTIREEEFVRRAGFVLITRMAVHDKKSPDEQFEQFFPVILKQSSDERNLVKKALSWALRAVGKRNLFLNGKAIGVARTMRQTGSRSARWIASDVIRELESQKVQERLLRNRDGGIKVKVIEDILTNSKTVAIVGLSPKEGRPSLMVGTYLKEHGYKIIPVNPSVAEVLGEKCYPNLTSIPEKVDVVDVFRKAEDMIPIVEDAIRIGAKAVWMQLEIINQKAAKIGRDAGLRVVMNRCMKQDHEKLMGTQQK